MALNNALDRAIMRFETERDPNLRAGYAVGGKVYGAYLENGCWEQFKQAMEMENPTAFAMYSAGGGKELEERRSGTRVYPPKMASFGSSSRMIYNLMKDDPGFLFEKKLPTVIGGIANLDGFWETDDTCVFVEAKCREPYSAKNGDIDRKYEPLYRRLVSVNCGVQPVSERKMQVRFEAGGCEIVSFDIKQMICHLLGVSAAYLKGEFTKRIDFVYLLFDPRKLAFDSAADKKAIMRIYEKTCQECESIDFGSLFEELLRYLQAEHGLGVNMDAADIAGRFSFRLLSQYTIK